MSKDFPVLGPEPNPPADSPTGGLPADFFADPRGAGSESGGPSPRPRGAPLPPRSSAPAPSSGGSSRRLAVLPVVAIVLLGNVVLFLGGLLAGWALATKGLLPGNSPSHLATIHLVNPVPSREGTDAPKVEIGGLEASTKRLEADLGGVVRELARLHDRFDRRQVPATAADLRSLQARVDDLAKAAGRLAPVPEKVQALGDRFDVLDESLESLRAEVASLPKQIQEAASSARTEAPSPVLEAEALVRGVGLFRERKFAEAREEFLKQTREHPDDARAWYLAALANGFATGNWGGESERLVKRGIGREQAGTPGRAEIDAQFEGLTKEQGKRWLWEWRERLIRR